MLTPEERNRARGGRLLAHGSWGLYVIAVLIQRLSDPLLLGSRPLGYALVLLFGSGLVMGLVALIRHKRYLPARVFAPALAGLILNGSIFVSIAIVTVG
ncbi:hypothetical protein KH5H1_70410 [Corallococcus caeni]|uniref:Sensor histidine kinase n=1 Tax=Corallococcus caeni TaxID=3082388 RepID=A0ABQ6QKC1_9BACT|nr:hypothetical protein KH5H1_70410 [Corallococcus sp. KH5-1]GMU04459.1 hypothetical protein ASNO1_07110 [Corallococcus sp. NO1]